jgi:hypothetical protein
LCGRLRRRRRSLHLSLGCLMRSLLMTNPLMKNHPNYLRRLCLLLHHLLWVREVVLKA